jgi:hypothetical protein
MVVPARRDHHLSQAAWRLALANTVTLRRQWH